MRVSLKTIPIALLGFGLLCAPVFAAELDVPNTANSAEPADPGTLNYIQGTAHLEGKLLNGHDVGSTTMDPGQVLTTRTGKAEILLTPGVFLRVGDHSAVQMISPDIAHTQVELLHGEAGVEVDEIHSQNDLEIIDGGVTTQLVKNGYYEFEAGKPTVLVFSGKAAVEWRDHKYRVVKAHHEMALVPGMKEKSVNFNPKDARDQLYNWSSLRSRYMTEESDAMAEQYGGMDGFDPGWYWDPYAFDYAFLGMDPFWSPFGFGFYPPWWGGSWWGGTGFYGGGYYGGGAYGRGFYGRGGYGRGSYGNGFRGGPIGHRGGGFRGGGFHGGGMGGGGFHGGGMGGGFHGGGMGGGGFHGGGGGHR